MSKVNLAEYDLTNPRELHRFCDDVWEESMTDTNSYTASVDGWLAAMTAFWQGDRREQRALEAIVTDCGDDDPGRTTNTEWPLVRLGPARRETRRKSDWHIPTRNERALLKRCLTPSEVKYRLAVLTNT